MRFSSAILNEIKSRISLYTLLSPYVKLKKNGDNYTGLCPFHQEKTPSFHLHTQRERYHCFGCGVDGDHFTFLIDYHQLSFPEAVEKLAAQAGVILQKSEESQEEIEKNTLFYTLHNLACQFYQACLKNVHGKKAYDYLKKRHIKNDTINFFQLGYAPSAWQDLYTYFKKLGYQDADLIESGLIVKGKKDILYDRFRDRLIFPITDHQDRVIAFGGRALDEDQLPKYLNSSDSSIFHKNHILYNYKTARNAYQKSQDKKYSILVVEGYMDVIALYQHNIHTAVAPLGTAFSPDHIHLIWRFCQEPVLCFDGDKAGKKASERALEKILPLLQPDHSFFFAHLPSKEDPDSYINQHGTSAFENILQKATPLFQYYFLHQLNQAPINTPERKAGFIKRLQIAENLIDNKIVRQTFKNFIFQELKKLNTSKNKNSVKPIFNQPSLTGFEKRHQEIILAGLLLHPALIEIYYEELTSCCFPHPVYEKLRLYLTQYHSLFHTYSSENLCTELSEKTFKEEIFNILHSDVFSLCPFLKKKTGISEIQKKWEPFLLQFMEKKPPSSFYTSSDLFSDEGWNKFIQLKNNKEEQEI